MSNSSNPVFVPSTSPYMISSTTSSTQITVTGVITYSNPHATVAVGPSDNDHERETRTKSAETIWSKLNISKFIPNQFRSALDLFREALSCYQNGAFMAACIMCRNATESMLFIAINSKYDPKSNQVKLVRQNNTKSGKPIPIFYKDLIQKGQPFLGQCIKWLKQDLDATDTEVGIIRHSGDLVAHYSEKLSNEFSGLTSSKPVELWKSEDSAFKILEKTATVLQTINDNFRQNNSIP